MPRHPARNALTAAVVVALTARLTGCAANQLSARTADPMAKVFPAAVDAMGDVGYAVTSTDKSSGLIVGEKQAGTGMSARLNVIVSDDAAAGGSKVVVKYIPPQDSLINPTTAQDYVKALQTRLPGLQVDVAK